MRIYSQLYAWLIMKDTPYYQDYSNHHKLLQLRRRVEGFESGEIYQKITAEYEKKLALKDKEINRLTKRNDLLVNKNQLLLSENKQLKTDMNNSKQRSSSLRAIQIGLQETWKPKQEPSVSWKK